ncbi:MAG: translesion DNA synthesis-associated protein ImuA [Wenzhouxiangellaceae bacterium]|nr:translesion DNA synthesis-associated protein ImuA [Wenzhouxiangellaceae bacterium]MBS3745550.1 translesion DNA synthesis-associated protein ImuA [Wenzhouxiangellaceae bacterium]MBS3822895.1 translesion DNA synthesis-associated protein ImuA [Wenzhouxiangellaceae bacterium]
MNIPNPLEKLLSERNDLWRGRRRRAGDALETGRAALDRRLPDGGWPRGKLIELLPERFGVGELDLLLPCLAELTRHERQVLFIAPPLVPCPQSLLRAGLDLTRLLIVREQKHAFWAAEQCLKSGLCGAVAVWPNGSSAVSDRTVRRLQLAAEDGDAPVFLCYAPGSTPPASLASLRLAIRCSGHIEILRSRGGETTGSIRLHPDNVVPLASAGRRE